MLISTAPTASVFMGVVAWSAGLRSDIGSGPSLPAAKIVTIPAASTTSITPVKVSSQGLKSPLGNPQLFRITSGTSSVVVVSSSGLSAH